MDEQVPTYPRWSQCSRKFPFRTKGIAERRIAAIVRFKRKMRMTVKKMDAYKYPHCNKWHIGTRRNEWSEEE